MRALLALIYGVAAYAAGMAALAYFVGFSANWGVPRTVDSGAVLPWPEALATDLLLIALFGLQHSLMARPAFKRWWTRLVPPVVERSTYLVATAAALAALFVFWRPLPAPVLWRVDDPRAAAAVWVLFAAGWLLVVASSFQIDHFELFGLRQVAQRWLRRPPPPAAFRTPLLYRHVRHPLYLGLLVGLWAVPVMSAGRALLALGLSAYILVGIACEERDLVRQFGDAYRRYRQQVGMLLPHLHRLPDRGDAQPLGGGPGSGTGRDPV